MIPASRNARTEEFVPDPTLLAPEVSPELEACGGSVATVALTVMFTPKSPAATAFCTLCSKTVFLGVDQQLHRVHRLRAGDDCQTGLRDLLRQQKLVIRSLAPPGTQRPLFVQAARRRQPKRRVRHLGRREIRHRRAPLHLPAPKVVRGGLPFCGGAGLDRGEHHGSCCASARRCRPAGNRGAVGFADGLVDHGLEAGVLRAVRRDRAEREPNSRLHAQRLQRRRLRRRGRSIRLVRTGRIRRDRGSGRQVRRRVGAVYRSQQPQKE
mmetsp:Transcript_18030/g.45103  ORF Transcript_18030/g.45103 Transcript_18030/m.45103 type:complete len:267 (-) Transcript_18030:341-1141(-)